MRTLRMLSVALVAAGCAAAQTTRIVNSAGGPGVFTTIQAALNAAIDGDTILVQPGSYFESPSTSKGVMVVADPGASIVSLPFVSIDISQLPAGKTFTLRGFDLSTRITVTDCAGGVHLEKITNQEGSNSGGLFVFRSAQVTVSHSRLRGLMALDARDSRVVATECSLRAVGMFCCNSPGVTIVNSTVTIVGGDVGGAPSFIAPGSPAIELSSGTLILAGRAAVVAAGQDTSGNAVPAVTTLGGRVEVDPAVTLASQNGAPGISGPATVVQQRIPSVIGTGLASAGTWTLDLHAPTGALFSLVASLPVTPAATPVGELWVDPTVHIVLGVSTVGPGDQFLWSLPLAQIPPGIPLAVQSVVLIQPRFRITPPSVNVSN